MMDAAPQLIVQILGVLAIPIAVYFVRAEVLKSAQEAKIEVISEIGELKKDIATRATLSDSRYIDVDRRIVAVENGHAGMHNRMDAIMVHIHSMDSSLSALKERVENNRIY